MSIRWQTELKKALKGDAMNDIQSSALFDQTGHELFPTVITASQLALTDINDPTDPIALQFIPTKDEQVNHVGFKQDPVGDVDATAATGLIHKYQGRVLLIASGSCAVNCRYCFRRHFEYNKNFAPRNNWQDAIQYINNDSSIHEVILSGGDPLTLSNDKIKSLMSQLADINHVKTLRIHSRIPVVLPERIDNELIDLLENAALKVVMVLHINHSKELSLQAQAAISRLKKAQITLLNQSVLLKNINDQASTLEKLSHDLHHLGILPYYLHVMDKVQNASHFDVPLEQAQAIHQELKASLPGYLVPKLSAEIQGQKSKTWLNKA